MIRLDWHVSTIFGICYFFEEWKFAAIVSGFNYFLLILPVPKKKIAGFYYACPSQCLL